MNKSTLDNKFLSYQGHFVTRYAWLIIIVALSLTIASLLYTKDNLGINNNSAEMLSPDLPFQQNTRRMEHQIEIRTLFSQHRAADDIDEGGIHQKALALFKELLQVTAELHNGYVDGSLMIDP